jgi:hypothetical protein
LLGEADYSTVISKPLIFHSYVESLELAFKEKRRLKTHPRIIPNPALIPIRILRISLPSIHSGVSGNGWYGGRPGYMFHQWQKLELGQPFPNISLENTRRTIDIAMLMAMLMRMGNWRKMVGAVRRRATKS